MGSAEDFEEFYKNYVKKYSTTAISTSGSLLSVISAHRKNPDLSNRQQFITVTTSNAGTPPVHISPATMSTGCSSSKTFTSSNVGTNATSTVVYQAPIPNGSITLKMPSKSGNGNSTVQAFPTDRTQSVKRTVDPEASLQGPQKKTKLQPGLPSSAINPFQTEIPFKSTTTTGHISVTLQQTPQKSPAVHNPALIPRSKSVIMSPLKQTTVSPSNSAKVSASNSTTVLAPNSTKILVPNSAQKSAPVLEPNYATISANNSASVSLPLTFQQFPVLPISTTHIPNVPVLLQNPTTTFFTRAPANNVQSFYQLTFPSVTSGPTTSNPIYLPVAPISTFQNTAQTGPSTAPNTPMYQYVTQNAYEVLKEISPNQFTDSFLEAGFFKAEKVEPYQHNYHTILNYIFNSQAHQRCQMEPLAVLKITRPSRILHRTSTVTSATPIQNPVGTSPKHPLKMMLWHGTRPRNVASILRYGFRCPQTGQQLFGKGVYFADRISKSAQYCNPNLYCNPIPRPGEIGYLFLCEVTLGTCYNAKNLKPSNQVAPSIIRHDGSLMTFDSLKCTGAYIPDRMQQREIDGVIWPLGPTIKNTRFPSYSVLYNEFVVYNPEMVKIKYLVKVQFK